MEGSILSDDVLASVNEVLEYKSLNFTGDEPHASEHRSSLWIPPHGKALSEHSLE